MAELLLSELMIQANLLSLQYREPSITAYNRLEPRPRSQNFERSLRAEVRDPLWMLTRQWQMGEFEAEDTGSAIDARIITTQTKVDRISFDHSTGEKYNDEMPMEMMVERESIVFKADNLNTTYGLRVKMGQYFLKLHSAALRTKYSAKYLEKFGFSRDLESVFKGQIDGLNLYIATRSSAIDGAMILEKIADSSFFSTAEIDGPDEAALTLIFTAYQEWFARQYSQPREGDTGWHADTLDYQFSVAAPYQNGDQEVLTASEYYTGRLDWYAFNENVGSSGISVTDPAIPLEKEEVMSFLPSPAEFKGMPNPRFWEMEERQIDFGKINAKTTDHLLLLFAEFGLIYGNDWSVIPYTMPVNTICEVKGLVVTDVFGDRTIIRAANEGNESTWQRWSMFNISNLGNMHLYNNQYYLPSTLTHTLESEPIERVNFIRDEMANMVWGIEEIIPDATGKGIRGDEAADQMGILPPEITGSTAAIRYVLGTSVPENWIPFLPVQKANSLQDIHFQRAAMPQLGDPPVDVVKAKGDLLNEVPSPYFINEEEIPYSGTILTRAIQRVRWYDGKTYIWRGRSRKTGRGQGGSNLRFDQIDEI